MMNDADIEQLLADQDGALRRWYVSVTPSADPNLVLTSGSGDPSNRRIRELFNSWFARRRDGLQRVICDDLGYRRVSQNRKGVGETALVAAVSSALTISPWADQIDPVATAAILVSTRMLDTLCSAGTTDENSQE